MKILKTLFAAAAAVMMTAAAWAAPHVQIEKAQQRYPWNGLMDVTYHVYDTDATHAYDFALAVTVGGVTKNVTVFGPTDPGQYVVTFDAAEYFPETFAKGCSLKAVLTDRGPKTGAPSDATGEAVGIVRDVMVIVIDSKDPANAADPTSFAVLYYTGCDIGKFNCEYYKKSRIALAKVPAGRYSIGQSEADDQGLTIANNPRRTCATKGFYMGLFEVTQWQYMLVAGNTPSYHSSGTDHWLYPVERVTWNTLRDSAAPDAAVTPSTTGGFIARLLAKAKVNGVALTGIDLPTAAQWEIAARAGSSTFYSWGNHLRTGQPLDLNVTKVFAKYGFATLEEWLEAVQPGSGRELEALDAYLEIGYHPRDYGFGYAWCPYKDSGDFPGISDLIGCGDDPTAGPLEREENMNLIHPVGNIKRPNAFGLYDCYDNIRELCRDAMEASTVFGEKYAERPVSSGTQRAICGWGYSAHSLDEKYNSENTVKFLSPSSRTAAAPADNGYYWHTHGFAISDQGFRLSVTLP